MIDCICSKSSVFEHEGRKCHFNQHTIFNHFQVFKSIWLFQNKEGDPYLILSSILKQPALCTIVTYVYTGMHPLVLNHPMPNASWLVVEHCFVTYRQGEWYCNSVTFWHLTWKKLKNWCMTAWTINQALQATCNWGVPTSWETMWIWMIFFIKSICTRFLFTFIF